MEAAIFLPKLTLKKQQHTLTKTSRNNKTFNHHPVGVRLEEISVRLKGDGPPLAARCEMKASPQHTNAQGISSDGLGPS
jgi:hypothetical protein